ncbi:hypothetical protein D5H75_11960 [Bailinhaonella thermotolerans]|uniref:Uncharacterized protein n=1 Tax=Bailinhaonella thermotolerans TaxID=1070861 RepID=A0A3A4BQR8_9ACTN|nr:hypothetical protein D5H75_11960 [Bailinhaonella thermotolerans]
MPSVSRASAISGMTPRSRKVVSVSCLKLGPAASFPGPRAIAQRARAERSHPAFANDRAGVAPPWRELRRSALAAA